MTVRRRSRRISATRARREGWRVKWPRLRRASHRAPAKAPEPAEPRQPAAQPPRTTARRYPSRQRKLGLFAGGLAACVGLLVFLGYVEGHGPDIGVGGFVESVLSAVTSGMTGT